MAPSIKNSKPNGLIDFSNWAKRVPSSTDAFVDMALKHDASFHGYVYNNTTGTAPATYNSTNSIIFAPGPYTEVVLHVVGAGTVVVKGGLLNDPNNLVSCNLVTSQDGLIRITSSYKFMSISATGLDATSQLYLQIW